MKLRWIGQSGYILEDNTTEIIIDPYLSDIVNKVKSSEISAASYTTGRYLSRLCYLYTRPSGPY